MPAFSFSKKEAFRVGWERFKERPFFVIGLFVITTLISTVSGYLVDKANAGPSVAFIFSVIDFAVQAIIGMGLTLILLRVHDNVTTDYSDLFEPIYLFWKYLAMTIIVFVVVIIGLLLFVIPGIIAAIALSFAPYLVIDKGMGPIDAVKESVEMTHGHRWNLFIFALLVAAFNVLGFLLLGVGLLITIPVSALAFVHIYRWLLHPKEESGVVVSWLSKILSAFVLFIIAVVVAFVILLGSLAASNSPQARDIERRADIAEMMLGVELYRDATGAYPESLNTLVPVYAEAVPSDPSTGEPYQYEQFGGGTDYELCALLETGGYYCEYGTPASEAETEPVFDGGFEFDTL